MDLIDSHVHVWDPVSGYPWLTGPLRRRYRLADLRRSVTSGVTVSVVPVEAGRGDAAETTDLLALAAADPLVAGVVGSADLHRPGAPRRLDTLVSGPHGKHLVGIRERFDDRLLSTIDAVAGPLAEHGLALELGCSADQFEQVAELVKALGPGVPVVLDHLAGPPADPRHRVEIDRWSSGLAELAALPDLYLKLSGFLTQVTGPPSWRVDVIRQAVKTLGPARTMIGSDWPVCLTGGGWTTAIDTVRVALIDYLPADLERVAVDTARAAFRLTDRQPVAATQLDVD
jgi:L-fuconolactonase